MFGKFRFRGTRAIFLCLALSVVGVSAGFLSAKTVLAVTKSRFEQLELFNKVLYLIETQYYRDVDSGKLIEGAIKGMMETLDPHSAFLNSETFERMQSETSGEFGGLGIEVTTKDGIIYVTTPIDDTPAFAAGIKARDKIVEIDHEPTIGLTLEQAVEKMRGPANSKIHIGVVREGVEGVKYFDIVRKIIKVKPVKFEIVKDNYAYVRLTQFQKRSASSIADALEKMEKDAKKKGGLKGIILDLRANPGGLLDEAVDVSSLFLKDGIVVSTEARDPNNKEIRYVNKTGYKNLETPIAVLINGASASASEIVSGALQDHKRALIMGSQSFGKGSVQTVAKVDGQNGVKLTIAQYMTPNGRKIQAIGITPDIELEEVEGEKAKGKKISRYIREKDLRNHLVATIETPEEKLLREKQEKEERIERAKEIEERRREEAEDSKNKKKTETVEKEDIFKKSSPSEDFQVIQAINYLKNPSALEKTKDVK